MVKRKVPEDPKHTLSYTEVPSYKKKTSVQIGSVLHEEWGDLSTLIH